LKVKPTSRRSKLVVTTDGAGIASHAGSAALSDLADRLGWTAALSAGMAPTRCRRSAHDPGQVVQDLIVSIADGGDCLADLSVLREQPDLFGEVASLPTAWRVIEAITPERLGVLREAPASSGAGMGERGGTGTDHAGLRRHVGHFALEKEGAAGNFKGGFGFHPLACYLDESNEALAGILRPGNAGANTAADHIAVLYQALEQLPDPAWGMEILARADSGGATHDFVNELRECAACHDGPGP
jgi:Transposase DDE domain group 1